jgi:hypothetical protein
VINSYPNPFYHTIDISAAGAFTHLALKNELGKTIWVKDYPGGTNSTTHKLIRLGPFNN